MIAQLLSSQVTADQTVLSATSCGVILAPVLGHAWQHESPQITVPNRGKYSSLMSIAAETIQTYRLDGRP
jgi:hypothetical protein